MIWLPILYLALILFRNKAMSFNQDLLKVDEAVRANWYFPGGGRSRSEVWKYYLKNRKGREVMCSLCQNIYSSGDATTSLWKHLLVKHQIKAK